MVRGVRCRKQSGKRCADLCNRARSKYGSPVRFWVKPLLVLAAVWLTAGVIIYFAKSARPTAKSIAAYLDAHSLAQANESDRAKVVDRVAEQLNKLDYPERQELRRTHQLDAFYKEMTDAERKHFLDLTLPQGFRQMMQAFNKMEPQRRKRFVEKAMAELEEKGPNPRQDENITPEERQKIVQEGLSAFYEEANADVKLEFAPLIEQLQRALQNVL